MSSEWIGNCMTCGERVYDDEPHECNATFCPFCLQMHRNCRYAVGDEGCTLDPQESCPLTCSNACLSGGECDVREVDENE